MSGFFNPNNAFFRIMTKVYQVCMLSLLWLICSIPIITMGAATTALNAVMLRLVRDEEGYLIRSFLKAFFHNMIQATALWLIALSLLLVLGGDIWFFYRLGGLIGMMGAGMFLLLLLVLLLTLTVLFHFQSWFRNPLKRTFANSARLALGYLPYSVALLLLLGVMGYGIYVSVPLMFLLGFFGIGIFSYISAYMWRGIFDKIAVTT